MTATLTSALTNVKLENYDVTTGKRVGLFQCLYFVQDKEFLWDFEILKDMSPTPLLFHLVVGRALILDLESPLSRIWTQGSWSYEKRNWIHVSFKWRKKREIRTCNHPFINVHPPSQMRTRTLFMLDTISRSPYHQLKSTLFELKWSRWTIQPTLRCSLYLPGSDHFMW